MQSEPDNIANEIIRRQTGIIEVYCEEMLQRGHGGVKIVRSRFNNHIEVTLDDDIPYGEIHEFLKD